MPGSTSAMRASRLQIKPQSHEERGHRSSQLAVTLPLGGLRILLLLVRLGRALLLGVRDGSQWRRLGCVVQQQLLDGSDLLATMLMRILSQKSNKRQASQKKP
jgi:hypothetical protein